MKELSSAGKELLATGIRGLHMWRAPEGDGVATAGGWLSVRCWDELAGGLLRGTGAQRVTCSICTINAELCAELSENCR